jgi:glycosyltransferase involved in cell wall biosynthesis
MKLKILHTFKCYYPDKGGVETVMRDIILGLRNYFTFSVLACKKRGIGHREKVDSIFVRRCTTLFTLLSLPIAPFYLFWFWWYARRVDIVDHHYPFPLVDLAVSIYFPKKTKLVIHWHADIIAQKRAAKLLAPALRKCVQRADKILVATPLHIEHSPTLAQVRDKCVVIPFGVDVDYWSTISNAQRQEIYRLQKRYPRLILAVGRLVPYKGYATLIDAMREIDGQLIIVGMGPLQKELQEMVREYNLAKKVIFKNQATQDELKVLLHAAKVFAFPSILPSEAFGIVQLEAMSCGKPIVNTALASGVPWVARDQQEALTVPPEDSVAFADALNHLLDDPGYAEMLGQAGLQRVREQFSKQQFLKATKDMYEELVSSISFVIPAKAGIHPKKISL